MDKLLHLLASLYGAGSELKMIILHASVKERSALQNSLDQIEAAIYNIERNVVAKRERGSSAAD